MLSGVIVDEWAKEIESVKDSPQKDSLKVIVNDLLKSLKNKETVFNDRVKSIMMTISTSVEDSIIESRELNFISEKIKTELHNERSTQN
jgi:hypothetical protein